MNDIMYSLCYGIMACMAIQETENNNVWTSFINLFQGNCVKLPLPVVNSHPSKLISFVCDHES